MLNTDPLIDVSKYVTGSYPNNNSTETSIHRIKSCRPPHRTLLKQEECGLIQPPPANIEGQVKIHFPMTDLRILRPENWRQGSCLGVRHAYAKIEPAKISISRAADPGHPLHFVCVDSGGLTTPAAAV
ncbi:MAG: hypothetical protein ACLQAH_17960 [Limisphaerales bacterium]